MKICFCRWWRNSAEVSVSAVTKGLPVNISMIVYNGANSVVQWLGVNAKTV